MLPIERLDSSLFLEGNLAGHQGTHLENLLKALMDALNLSRATNIRSELVIPADDFRKSGGNSLLAELSRPWLTKL